MLLAVLVFGEAALMLGTTGFLVFELFAEPAHSLAGAIALTALSGISAGWLVVVGFGVLSRRAWTRGAALVWQVLQCAVALGLFQGAFATPVLGWWLLLPALAALVLLFTPQVVSALRRD